MPMQTYSQEEYEAAYEEGYEEGREQGREDVTEDPMEFMSRTSIDEINEEYATNYSDEWCHDSVILNLHRLDRDTLLKLGREVVGLLEE